ncbi:MAG: hypothetical protein E4H36_05895 [Spirochaetales bacterium]|nr:MAG: hypothetical protein E4H36_05895 [Spirochaetales bacterium]
MKKILLVLCILGCIGLAPAFSQTTADLTPLSNDLSALLEGIGNETIPYLQQSAMLGEGIGRAHMGDGSPFFFAFSLGATFSPGILTFIDEENTNFELLNVNGLLTELGSGLASTLNTFKTFMFYPQTRFAIGVQLPLRFEIIGMFSILPQFLTTAVTGLVNEPVLSGLQLNRMNAGLRVRKVLLADQGGFPAISLGVGYTYSNFNLSLLLPFPAQNFSGYNLNIAGSLALTTSLHSLGFDVGISKKLAIFYPYLRIGGWYQWAAYEGSVADFSASLTDQTTNTVLASVDSTTAPIISTLAIRDMTLLVEGGIEIALGGFIITPSGSYNLGSNSFDASLAFRLQLGTKSKDK